MAWTDVTGPTTTYYDEGGLFLMYSDQFLMYGSLYLIIYSKFADDDYTAISNPITVWSNV